MWNEQHLQPGGLGEPRQASHGKRAAESAPMVHSPGHSFSTSPPASDSTHTGQLGAPRPPLSSTAASSTGNKDYDAVAHFYNSNRQTTTINDRKDSPILRLKNLNNWVKAVLIAEMAAVASRATGAGTTDDGPNSGLGVLDLCGGKGGDIRKYSDIRVTRYVLADIATTSVQSAIQRLQVLRSRPPLINQTLFISGNLCCVRLHEHMHPSIMFDLVSCQFAFHYSFQCEDTARRLLQNAADRLKPGGVFTGTIPDARVLVRRLRASRNGRFGNSRYEVCFDDTRPDREDENEARGSRLEYATPSDQKIADDAANPPAPLRARTPAEEEEDAKYWANRTFPASNPFGVRYYFTLQDAVECVPEYLVPFPTLCALAADYGLRPILLRNIQAYFADKIGTVIDSGVLRRAPAAGVRGPYRGRGGYGGGHGFGGRPEQGQGQGEAPAAGDDSNKDFGPNLLRKINVLAQDGSFPEDQWEASGVYCVFAFQKVPVTAPLVPGNFAPRDGELAPQPSQPSATATATLGHVSRANVLVL